MQPGPVELMPQEGQGLDLKELLEVLPRLERMEAWVNGGFRVSNATSFMSFHSTRSTPFFQVAAEQMFLRYWKCRLLVQEYQIRETDKALTTMEARGIQHNVFQQGQLAYFYDSGREVPVGCFGYHRITKREALADWPAYMHKAQPSEVPPSRITPRSHCASHAL